MRLRCLFRRCGRNVLIDAKKVVGIKLALEQRQPLEFVTIRSADAGMTLVFEVIYIHRSRRKRFDSAEESLDPSPRFFAIARLLPIGVDPEFKSGSSKAESIIVKFGAPGTMPV